MSPGKMPSSFFFLGFLSPSLNPLEVPPSTSLCVSCYRLAAIFIIQSGIIGEHSSHHMDTGGSLAFITMPDLRTLKSALKNSTQDPFPTSLPLVQ